MLSSCLFWKSIRKIGKQCGYKALQDGRVVASKKAAPGAPFVAWSQWANHMYLYQKDTPALNARPQRTAKTLRVGVQQYTRALQTIPDELRTRFLRKNGAALCLWELRQTKKLRAPETPEFLPWVGELRAGFFWADCLEHAQRELLALGFAPQVSLAGLFKKSSLRVRLSPTETCVIRQKPEDHFWLQELAQHLQLPYKGTSNASFAYQTLLDLLRHKRGVTSIGPGQCWVCGAPGEQVDHRPPLSRNTEPSEERRICCQCHDELTGRRAL